jgi:dihydroflavonol-4-reductase
LIRVVERGQPGRRYLLGGENFTIRSLFEVLSQLTGRRVPRVTIPYPVALGFAYLSEFLADHFTGVMPQATVTGVRLTRRLMHFDCASTRAELGLDLRPIRESLRQLLAWYDQVSKKTVKLP